MLPRSARGQARGSPSGVSQQGGAGRLHTRCGRQGPVAGPGSSRIGAQCLGRPSASARSRRGRAQPGHLGARGERWLRLPRCPRDLRGAGEATAGSSAGQGARRRPRLPSAPWKEARPPRGPTHWGAEAAAPPAPRLAHLSQPGSGWQRAGAERGSRAASSCCGKWLAGPAGSGWCRPRGGGTRGVGARSHMHSWGACVERAVTREPRRRLAGRRAARGSPSASPGINRAPGSDSAHAPATPFPSSGAASIR